MERVANVNAHARGTYDLDEPGAGDGRERYGRASASRD